MSKDRIVSHIFLPYFCGIILGSVLTRSDALYVCLGGFYAQKNPHISKMDSTSNSRATSTHVARLDRTLKDLQRQVKKQEETLKKVSSCQFCKAISRY